MQNIEKSMEKVWNQVIKDYKPEYIYCSDGLQKLAAEHMELWDRVMNPNIYQIFPALKRKR